MNSIIRFVAQVALLVLLLSSTPSWSQPVCLVPGCNSTRSDDNGNTAGGTGALPIVVIVGPVQAFSNTAFGFDALFSNTIGNSNTAIGQAALAGNTTGNHNTANGLNALQGNTTGNSNTASGSSALNLNTTGNDNVAVGPAALGLNTTGSSNTALGSAALIVNTTGNRNTGVGFRALQNSTGTRNIGIGYLAGTTLTSGNNNIYIGNQGNGDENQTIRIGTAQTQTFIAGITGSVDNSSPVVIDTATGQLGIPSSSARYKRDIEVMANRSEGLLKLRPVTFAYEDDAAAAPHYGLVAEEVATVYPELVTRTATGEVQTVKYHELISMLLNELQREHQARQDDRAEMVLLRKQLAVLRSLLGSRLPQ